MIINDCFKVRCLIVAVTLISGLGLVTDATAQERSFLIDLNTKAVTELGTLGGDYIRSSAINDKGQVVGESRTSGGDLHAFITGPNGGGISDLGTLGGSYSSALDINNAGQVIGTSMIATGERQAFITETNGMGMRSFLSGSANAINNEGQVVGESNGRPFITGPNGVGMIMLGDLGHGPGVASDVNDTGQVTGHAPSYPLDWFPFATQHVFITGPDGSDIRDIGHLGGDVAYGFALNNSGQVVGYGLAGGGPYAYPAFITGPDGAGMRELGTLGGESSIAGDINDAGQVVGWSLVRVDPVHPWARENFHAFVTGPNGEGMMDLNSLVDLPDGVILSDAVDINNAGQVIAIGAIPEPETYALMLAGLGLVGFMARRRKAENQV